MIKQNIFLIWILVLIMGLFFNSNVVKAEGNMETFCRYKYNTKEGVGKDDLKEGKYEYTIFDVIDQGGTVKYTTTKSSGMFIKLIETSSLPSSYFYEGGQFYCPKSITAEVDKDSDGWVTIKLFDEKESGKRYYFERMGAASTRVVSADAVELSEGTCEGILGTFKDDLEGALKIIRFLGPIFVIIFGTYDYCNGIFSKDADILKKANSKMIKRLVLIAVLYFIPIILNIILGIVDATYTTCIY